MRRLLLKARSLRSCRRLCAVRASGHTRGHRPLRSRRTVIHAECNPGSGLDVEKTCHHNRGRTQHAHAVKSQITIGFRYAYESATPSSPSIHASSPNQRYRRNPLYPSFLQQVLLAFSAVRSCLIASATYLTQDSKILAVDL